MKLERKTLTNPLIDCALKFAKEGNTYSFEGYASKYNGVDSYGDTIMPGAYDKVIKGMRTKEHRLPAMLFNHKSWELPVGKWAIPKSDDVGLFVQGELTKGLRMSEDIHVAMQAETLDGLSVGIRLQMDDVEYIDEEAARKGGIYRIIKNVTRLAEISPVTFPADDGARIDLSSVKSEIDTLETVSDVECFLREAGGFSKSVSSALMHRLKLVLRSESASEADTKAVMDLFRFNLR